MAYTGPKKRRQQVGAEETLKSIMNQEARDARKQYEEWQLEQELNPANQRYNEKRLILQIISEREKEILKIRMKACKTLSERLTILILRDLDMNTNKSQYNYDVTKDQIEEVIKYYKVELMLFEQSAKEIPAVKKYNYYDQFFINLFKYSMNFLYFAPEICLTYPRLEFCRLTEDERQTEMKPFLEKHNLLSNEEFTTRYGKYFDDGVTV